MLKPCIVHFAVKSEISMGKA
ncbi:hypothetical protein PENANT_c022G10178 [Penicillium antarcticum]|uniref:Uncharacterized protein n=1 Tax=Penicillium antarcticum TaxID=416450 RepID=A0A1V6PZ51_9EURO|nr:hypothetical protein PENANT_c022G10178 [Penicillium antarcticum]